MRPETQVDRFRKDHPWLFRWEWLKLSTSCFFWRFHPGRNRWCKKCDEFIGNSRAEANAHKCKEP